MWAKYQTKKKFDIFGSSYKTFDGTCIRDFIHIKDLADIHFVIIKKFKKKNTKVTINCGYGKGFSVLEVVNTFKKISNYPSIIKFLKKREGDIERSVSSVKKLEKMNWKPKYKSLTKMLKSSLDWEINQ